MSVHYTENDARPRCPGCGHSCCPHAGLECGGDSDAVRQCTEPAGPRDATDLPLPCWGEEDENGVWHCAVCGRRGDEDCDPAPHWRGVFPPGEGATP
jgi:hypothetical protein